MALERSSSTLAIRSSGERVPSTAMASDSTRMLEEARRFANRLPSAAEWGGFVNRLPRLRSTVEKHLLGHALGRYETYCRDAGMPGRDQISRAVQLRLLLEIYGLTNRQTKQVLADRRNAIRTEGGHVATSGAADVLRSNRSLVFGDEVYAAACSELGYGISRHCQTFYGVSDIDNYARRQLISMEVHGAGVDRNVAGRLIYFSDEQAVHHRVMITSGKLFVPTPGAPQPLDTTQMVGSGGNTAHQGPEKNNWDPGAGQFGPSVGVAGFAMTLNRDLFVSGSHSIRDRNGAAYSFYHSSYVSGEDVVCTGCLTAVNGTLTYINNWSGHYKPSPSQVQIVLESLQVRGVDISNVIVQYKTAGGSDVQIAPHFMQLQQREPGRAAAPRVKAIHGYVSEVGQKYVAIVKRIIDAYDAEEEGWKAKHFWKKRKKSAESKAVCAYFKGLFSTGRPDANCLFSLSMLLTGNISPGLAAQVEQMAQSFGSQQPLPAQLKPGSTLWNRLQDAAFEYHQIVRS
jgi:hypothetical protein